MKIHNPFYLAFALALTGFVAVANHNGWNMVHSVAARTLPRSFGYSGYYSTQHK